MMPSSKVDGIICGGYLDISCFGGDHICHAATLPRLLFSTELHCILVVPVPYVLYSYLGAYLPFPSTLASPRTLYAL